MNLLDAYVTKIVTPPYRKMNGWCVDVEYLCWSDIPSRTTLFYRTEAEAKAVGPGWWFRA